MLQNYDEFGNLKALQNVDMNDDKAVEEFKLYHFPSEMAFLGKIFWKDRIDKKSFVYRDIHKAFLVNSRSKK